MRMGEWRMLMMGVVEVSMRKCTVSRGSWRLVQIGKGSRKKKRKRMLKVGKCERRVGFVDGFGGLREDRSLWWQSFWRGRSRGG
jgi:hypothetical protein